MARTQFHTTTHKHTPHARTHTPSAMSTIGREATTHSRTHPSAMSSIRRDATHNERVPHPAPLAYTPTSVCAISTLFPPSTHSLPSVCYSPFHPPSRIESPRRKKRKIIFLSKKNAYSHIGHTGNRTQNTGS